MGPGAPLPGRPRPQDGRPRSLRHGRAGGVRRRRVRLHLPLRRHRGARSRRPVGRHHPVGRGGLGINPILTYGTREQKERWLPDLVAGRALAAFGLTEPEAGSDAGATRTRALLEGESWVIDGAKAFITNSGTPITSVVTVT